ncbi:MAG: hypothetical protein IT285_00290 [Bdellovibrionales bacterium]|nr:hypothetical protein [Bdellovibrionales bacterium]
MSRLIRARAPSNIALVKYMGKADALSNLPANPSVSLTLSGLATEVELRPAPGATGFHWVSEAPVSARAGAWRVPTLSDRGVARFLRHAERAAAAAPELLADCGLEFAPIEGAELRSANSFPAGAGIASSASSFAALTLTVIAAHARDPQAFRRTLESPERGSSLRARLASLSRQGSGSSCRSFDGPWVRWENAEARPLRSRLEPLTDFVLLVRESEKAVGSSEAHSRVLSSPLWKGRSERAASRASELALALESADFQAVCALAWAEFQDMHALFHSSAERFSYWEPESERLLEALQPWVESGHPRLGPVCVTMDAGANVHVLVPERLAPDWERALTKLAPGLPRLSDAQGLGARVIQEGEGE